MSRGVDKITKWAWYLKKEEKKKEFMKKVIYVRLTI